MLDDKVHRNTVTAYVATVTYPKPDSSERETGSLSCGALYTSLYTMHETNKHEKNREMDCLMKEFM